MRRCLMVAGILLGLAAFPSEGGVARGDAAGACARGTTMFVASKVRIFAIPFRSSDEFGEFHYACRGTRARRLEVGDFGSGPGVALSRTEVYALTGGRYLGAYATSESEGGGDAELIVTDLRTRRRVVFATPGCCPERRPEIRVAADGTGVALDEVVAYRRRGFGRMTRLSDEGARVADLALAGGTVYWSQDGVARSAHLDGLPAGGREERSLGIAPRRLPGCAVPGRVLAASPRVRVGVRGERRVACRTGSRRRVPLESDGAVTIVADRWILVRDGQAARLVDVATGRSARTTEAAAATATEDGALAWIAPDGAVRAARPGAPAVELAPAGAAPTGLAAGGRTVYWTAGGAPGGAHVPRR